MKNSREKICSSGSEYLKIRRYVMNILWKNNNELEPIPSLNELMVKFNVSRPTACKAVRELIREGYLIAKRGHGTFINPAKSVKNSGQFGKRHLPIIGILIGDGLHVHFEIFFSFLMAELLKNLAVLPACVHLLNFGGVTPGAAFSEIVNEKLDGLCWIQPPECFLPTIIKLRDNGLKVVTGATAGDSNAVDVAMDSLQRDMAICRLLHQEGRRNIVYLQQCRESEAQEAELREIFTGNLPDRKIFFFSADDSAFEKLEKLLKSGERIDAIINPFMPYPDLKSLLEKLQIDTMHDCRIVQSSMNLYGEPEPRGIIYDIPFAAFAGAIAERFKAGNSSLECSMIPYDIRKMIT